MTDLWRGRLESMPIEPPVDPGGRVVVISAHPDDEVLAVGGWLSEQTHREVVFVTATDGEGPAWRGAGMHWADTRTLDLHDVVARAVGGPGEYVGRPGFWAGAIGIAACWLGGAHGVARTLEDRAPRLDAHGLAHLGAVRASLDVAGLALEAAAARLDGGAADTDELERLALSLRAHVADVVESTISHVGRALGPAPLAFDARHAEHVADLQVFVRQHHAERDLEQLGALEEKGDVDA